MLIYHQCVNIKYSAVLAGLLEYSRILQLGVKLFPFSRLTDEMMILVEYDEVFGTSLNFFIQK